MNLVFKTATGTRFATVEKRQDETFDAAFDRALEQLDRAAEAANEATIASILGKGDSAGDPREEYVNGVRYFFEAGFWVLDTKQALVGPDTPRWYTVGEMNAKKRQEADELRMVAAERERFSKLYRVPMCHLRGASGGGAGNSRVEIVYPEFKHPLSVETDRQLYGDGSHGLAFNPDGRDYGDENDTYDAIPDGSGYEHASDCAQNNGPALPVGDCDCDGYDYTDAEVEIGSVVELVSGGPFMTVIDILAPGALNLSTVAHCIWFDANDHLCTDKIETKFLAVVA